MAEPFDTLDTARDLAKKGRNFALQAIQAADNCDAEKANRMAALATPLLNRAEQTMQTVAAAELAQLHYDDAIQRVIASGRRYINQINAALALCGGFTPIYEYEQGGGQFERIEDTDTNNDLQRNQVKFVFEISRRLECEEILFISTYHIENDATGETLIKPSEGDNRFDGDGGISEPPSDRDAVDGHVIDAGSNAPKPSWFHDTNGNKITVFDRPSFVKVGFTAYFETCVVCFSPPPMKILACVSWSYSGTTGKAEINPAGPGAPSLPFQRSLWQWLYNRR